MARATQKQARAALLGVRTDAAMLRGMLVGCGVTAEYHCCEETLGVEHPLFESHLQAVRPAGLGERAIHSYVTEVKSDVWAVGMTRWEDDSKGTPLSLGVYFDSDRKRGEEQALSLCVNYAQAERQLRYAGLWASPLAWDFQSNCWTEGAAFEVYNLHAIEARLSDMTEQAVAFGGLVWQMMSIAEEVYG